MGNSLPKTGGNMLPAIPAITKHPPAVMMDRSSLPSAEPVPLESLQPVVHSSTSLQEDSLVAFLPPEPRFFIGRKEQLENLHKILQGKKVVVVIPEEEILCKIGKSAVASQYVKGSASVLWIPARNRKALDAGFSQLGKQFNVESSKVRDYLSKQDQLIVFDGAQDSELLKEYIPQGQCQVIITSRQREWPFSQIKIGPFSPEEAVDFLCQRTQKNDRIAAKKIAEELDCLPTSLERAAKIFDRKVDAELSGYDGLVNGILDAHGERLKERSNLGDRNRNFTGRELALVALEETLKTHSRAVITGKRRVAAEVGLGGIGKTQIALQYAFRNADKYPYLVWRINCESDAALQGSYDFLAEKLGIDHTAKEKEQENSLIKKVNQRLEKETGWLLIYDNAENQKNLEGLIPQTGGHVLITSRSPDWDIGFAHVFKVGVFKRKESIALIQKMSPLNEADANRLAELVKDLPLAVAQAAAYIREIKIPYTEYARIFNEKSQQLLPAQDPTDEYSKTVNMTWQISMEKIAEKEKAEAEALSAPYPISGPLMNLCAFFDSRDIPRDLLFDWIKIVYQTGEASLNALSRSLDLLRAFSMIELNERGISIHPLVQLITRLMLREEEVQKTYNQGVMALRCQIDPFNFDNTATWHPARPSIPHALILTRRPNFITSLDSKEKCQFLDGLARVCYHLGLISQSLQCYQQISEIAEKIQDEKPIEKAERLNSIGMGYQYQGKFSEAMEFHSKALQIIKDNGQTLITQDENLELARIFNNTGLCSFNLHDYETALVLHDYALTIRKRWLKDKHPDVAASLNNKGLCFMKLNKYDEALSFYTQALEIEREKLDSEHPHIAISIINIGFLFWLKGEYSKSLQYYDEALKILIKNFGNKHSNVAKVLSNKGLCHYSKGEYVAALECHRQALDIRKEILGDNNLDTAVSQHNIGCCYQSQGEYVKALSSFEQALKIRKEHLDDHHPDIVENYNNIGMALKALHRYEQAFMSFKWAFIGACKNYPARHPKQELLFKNLVECLNNPVQTEITLKFRQEALPLAIEKFGADDPLVRDFI